MMAVSIHIPSIVVHTTLVGFVVCLRSTATWAFALNRHTPSSVSNPSRPQMMAPAFAMPSGGRLHSRTGRISTGSDCRRRAVCSMSGEHHDAVSSFDPLGFGGRSDTGHMFNSDGGTSRRQKRVSRIMNARVDRRGRTAASGSREKTALNAVHVGADDGKADAREQELPTESPSRKGQERQNNSNGNGAVAVSETEEVAGPSAKGWEYWSYRVLLLGVAAIWGTNFPVVKFVENQGAVSDATAAFVRFSIAAGALLPFVDWREKEVLFAGMEVGAWVAFGYFTQAIGLQTSDASVCAFLCSLTVVFVPLIDTLAGKGIKLVTLCASLLALLGTGFLELGDAHASWNDLWCVAQAVGFGAAFTRIEHYMNKFPGKSLQLSIGQLISVAGLTGVWCAYSSGGHLPDVSFMKDPPVAAALAYTGLVTTSLAVWLETIALEKVPAAEMSVIFSTEPLWATFVSRMFLKETMGPNAAVGAGFILLACLTAQSEQIKEILGMGTPKEEVVFASSDDEAERDELKEDDRSGGDDDHTGGKAFPSSVMDEVEVAAEMELDSSFKISFADDCAAVPMNTCTEALRHGGGYDSDESESRGPGNGARWLASVIRSEESG